MPIELTKRELLGTSAAVSAWMIGTNLLVGLAVAQTPPSRPTSAPISDYPLILSDWREGLVGSASSTGDQRVISAINTLVEEAKRVQAIMRPGIVYREGYDYLWSLAEMGVIGTGPLDRETALVRCTQRLRTMALAVAYPEAPLSDQQRADMRAAVVNGLTWIGTNMYNGGIERRGDWWGFEIGGPTNILDALILLNVAGTEAYVIRLFAGIDRFNPDPSREQVIESAPLGQWPSRSPSKPTIFMLRHCYTRSFDNVEKARRSLVSKFLAESGDGWRSDSSFVVHEQHYAYTGAYGADFISRSANVIYALRRTVAFRFQPYEYSEIVTRLSAGYDPWIYRGMIPGAVHGRAISRFNWSDRESAKYIILYSILLGECVDTRASVRSLAKRWLRDARIEQILSYDPKSPSYIVTRGLARLVVDLLNDTSVAQPTEQLTRHFQFPQMGRVMHRRPNFAFSIAMYSARNGNYELLGGENLKGWHTGSGMTYFQTGGLSGIEDDHFLDAFWPTVDPLRMPGTTVLRGPAPPPENSFGTNLAGGANGGGHGSACMVLSARYTTNAGATAHDLSARKSWFMFGDFICAVGSSIGVSVPTSARVETVIENRRHIPGSARTVRVGMANAAGQDALSTPNVETSLANYAWVHISGVGGFVFPRGSATLRGLDQTRSGSWRDINTRSASPPAVNPQRYATLWFDHGTNPAPGSTASRYAYVFIPSASESQMPGLATAPPIAVLEGGEGTTASIHYARYAGNGVVLAGANFFSVGTSTTNDGRITSNGQASVFLRQTDTVIEVCIADPTHLRTSLTVRVNIATTGVLSTGEQGVTFARSANYVEVTISDPLLELKGSTRKVIFSRNASASGI